MSLRLEELLPSMAKTDRQARKLIKTGMKWRNMESLKAREC
jgi:hypothetical protein